MSLVLRIFKSGADTANASNILFQGAQQATIHAFMESFAPGTSVSSGEYVALNHDDSGQYSDSPVVPFPGFKTRLQAQAPTNLSADVQSDAANASASDSTANNNQAPADSTNSSASSNSTSNLFANSNSSSSASN